MSSTYLLPRHHQLSRLCACPYDVLEAISIELVLLDPLGPPSDLVPLLQTCQHVNEALAFKTNSTLYARILRCQFDYRAVYRRHGPRVAKAKHQASQLQRNWMALKRIRSAIAPPVDDRPAFKTFVHDLWIAYILYMENDGRNEAQLEWANIKSLADTFVRTRLWERRDQTRGWPAETTVNALMLWLLWFATDAETLAAESEQQRQQIMELVRPYVIVSPRYPSFHAPDNHFDFPLPSVLQDQFPYTLVTPHGFYPLYREPEFLEEHVKHFDMMLSLSAPLITIAAKLHFFSRSEVIPFPVPSELSRTRAESLAAGRTYVHPTQEDIIEWNAWKACKFREKGTYEWRSLLNNEQGELEDDGVWRKGSKALSARMDNDWQRISYCYDPWISNDLKGVTYTYGMLSGLWQGRLIVPDFNQYFALVTADHFPTDFSSSNPRLAIAPLQLRLREHHSIMPEIPCVTGGIPWTPVVVAQNDGENGDIEIVEAPAHPPQGFNDDPNNGWFAPIKHMREHNGIVRIEDDRGNVSKYETYVEGRPNSHSVDTCSQCIRKRKLEEELARLRYEDFKATSGKENAKRVAEQVHEATKEEGRGDEEVVTEPQEEEVTAEEQGSEVPETDRSRVRQREVDGGDEEEEEAESENRQSKRPRSGSPSPGPLRVLDPPVTLIPTEHLYGTGHLGSSKTPPPDEDPAPSDSSAPSTSSVPTSSLSQPSIPTYATVHGPEPPPLPATPRIPTRELTPEEIHDEVNQAIGPDINLDDLLDFEMGSNHSQHSTSDSDDGEGSEAGSEAATISENESESGTSESESDGDDRSEADTDYDEFVENTCNGIQDIIITGETIPRHGAAWNHFRFYGRVRRWDGLIALVRVPTESPHLGIWIFRGYVSADKNFIGNWRAFSSNVTAIPWEGSFVASRIGDA